MELKDIVAKNLVELRKIFGFTQLEKAEKLNYSDKAVSRWERAQAIPDAKVLLQLAELFGVTVDYLLGRTSYRYSLDTLNEEYTPGMTAAELVDIIQHFSPQNTASFLDYIELLQLRQKAEDCSSTS